jgi:hypothetical protein
MHVCRNGICDVDPRRIFVTEDVYKANLGGLTGADAKCQSAASGRIVGTFKAWLSDSTGSPSTRMTHGGPYQRAGPSVFVVANNWAELTSGTLQRAIQWGPTGGTPPAAVNACTSATGTTSLFWSNTTNQGTLLTPSTSCSNWTSESMTSVAWGDYTRAVPSSAGGPSWTQFCTASGAQAANTCGSSAPLVCVQQ